MEIVVVGRNTEISDRFRDHVEEKLEKVEQLAPLAQRLSVEGETPTRSAASVRVRVGGVTPG